MKNEITGILVTTDGEVKKATIEDSLDGYYIALKCDCIDITVRRIGSKNYNIVCDDEGLLKDKPVITALTTRYEPALVGNLFICNDDEKGHLISLSEEEIIEVLMNTVMMYSDGKLREVIQIWA